MNKESSHKRIKRDRRHARVRAVVKGTEQRPRLSVHRSLQHVTAQLIDDAQGRTLAAATTRELKADKGTKTNAAAAVGKLIAERAQAKQIHQVVFDRGGNRYHGRVKALAEAAREAGLQF